MRTVSSGTQLGPTARLAYGPTSSVLLHWTSSIRCAAPMPYCGNGLLTTDKPHLLHNAVVKSRYPQQYIPLALLCSQHTGRRQYRQTHLAHAVATALLNGVPLHARRRHRRRGKSTLPLLIFRKPLLTKRPSMLTERSLTRLTLVTIT